MYLCIHMKRKSIIIALCAALGSAAYAGVDSPDAGGWLERGLRMYADGNYRGCLDQLGHARHLDPTPEQIESMDYHCAFAALALGYDDAEQRLRRFLADYPVSPLRADVSLGIGDFYFGRGRYAEALTEYAQVNPLALNGARADDLSFRISYCYMLLGEQASAASGFRSLQSSREYGAAARFYLGYLAYTKGDYPLALQYFRSADTSSAPGNAAPYYEAQISFAQGDFNRAYELASRLAKEGTVKEFLPECNRIAGESLYNLGDDARAEEYLWKYCAEAAEPQPSAYYILGVGEFRRGDYDAAIKLLQKAVGTHNAMEQSAYLYLGQAYLKRGDNNSALMAFEQAYRMDYDREVRETAFYNYAVARMDGGRVPFGNSVSLLESFLNEYPGSTYSADVERYIVNGYMSDNDYEAALRSIEKIKSPSEELLGAKARVLLTLGSREYASGKTAQAITHLTEGRNVASKLRNREIGRQCDLWLGECYYTRRDYDRAAEAYKAYIAAAPKSEVQNRILAYYDLGYTRFAQERWSDAVTDFRDAISVIGSSAAAGEFGASLLPDCYNRLADCRYYLGDIPAAESSYAKAYELNPSSGDYALYQLAVMKGLRKDQQGKIEGIDRLMAKFPSSGLIPAAMLQKAESQAALGRSDEAVVTYRQLVERYPNTASGRNGYLQLAITQINRGDRAQGIDTYKKVISTYPTSEEARIAADDLKQIYAADGRLGDFVNFINSVPGAPRYEASELERLAFQAAENDYVASGATAKLKSYVDQYPSGADRAQALYYLADAAWNAGEAATALGLTVDVLTGHPDSDVAEDALLIKGAAESQLGRTEDAYSTYRQLEGRASGSNMLREARLGLMRTAADLGKSAEVVENATKLLASTAANSASTPEAEIRFMRAMANADLGNAKEAEEELKELSANLSDLYGVKSAYYLGQGQLDHGHLKEAQATAERIIDSDTPHQYWLARGFILYSDVLRRQGKEFEADEYLKSLKLNYPGSEADIFQMIETRLN